MDNRRNKQNKYRLNSGWIWVDVKARKPLIFFFFFFFLWGGGGGQLLKQFEVAKINQNKQIKELFLKGQRNTCAEILTFASRMIKVN